jgi:hypothetical protein
MSVGDDPQSACERALQPIIDAFPAFSGGLVCLRKDGKHGATSYKMSFSYSMMSDKTDGKVQVITVEPMEKNLR